MSRSALLTQNARSAGSQRVSALASRSFGLIQRHPVLSVFCLALAARALLSVLITVSLGSGAFSDDATYSEMAAERAAGDTGGWNEYTHWLYERTATFLVPLTLVYRVFGPEPLAGRLLVALLGSAAAAATTRLAMEALPVRWALAAGAAVALLPSQVLFSSLVLKDAAVWAVLATLGLVSALVGRSTGRRLLLLLLGAGVLLVLLSFLRMHTLVVASWALALASLAGDRAGRAPRLLGALALLVVVPLSTGAGAAGINLIHEQEGTLGQKRVANAQGAETSFVDDASGGYPVSGAVRGVRAVVLDPLPWHHPVNSQVALARVEAVTAWWPLLALAVVGCAALRRHRRVLAFPVLAGGAIALMYGLTEGNFGTAYRHRGEFVWAVALLAAVGGQVLMKTGRRRGGGPAEGSASPADLGVPGVAPSSG
jgi:hypothetical protein